MDVQSLKRWHWIVIGLVAGSLFAAAKLMSASDERLGGPGFLSQAEFERSLRVPPAGSRPFVSGIVIHTGPRADLVRFRQLTAALEYAELRFAAPRPYRPLGESAPASENYTVGNYLTDMAATNPSLSFRTAWWDSAGPQLAIGATVGALLIGGAWPVLLRLMVGAGLGRKGEPRYDLDRFHHGPDEKKDVTLTEVNCAHLAELEAEMLASLGSAGEAPIAPEEPGCRAAAAPPRRDLCAAQIEPAASAPAVPDKAYDGQFYPVEKKAPHAFTVVELLVVIGIIAILASFLMPALRTARLEAQTVQCAGQIQQIGAALQMYANANQNWLPAWSGWHTWPAGQSEDSEGPAWTIELAPFIGPPDSRVYNCPSFPDGPRCRNYFLAGQWSGRSGRRAMKLTDVTMTGRFVLSGDKTQRSLYPRPFGTSDHHQDDADPDDCGYGRDPVLAWPWDGGGFYMHRRGNNVLFDDMHVALVARYDRNTMTFNPHRMEDWAAVTPD